jgi:hypothetical protein
MNIGRRKATHTNPYIAFARASPYWLELSNDEIPSRSAQMWSGDRRRSSSSEKSFNFLISSSEIFSAAARAAAPSRNLANYEKLFQIVDRQIHHPNAMKSCSIEYRAPRLQLPDRFTKPTTAGPRKWKTGQLPRFVSLATTHHLRSCSNNNTLWSVLKIHYQPRNQVGIVVRPTNPVFTSTTLRNLAGHGSGQAPRRSW